MHVCSYQVESGMTEAITGYNVSLWNKHLLSTELQQLLCN